MRRNVFIRLREDYIPLRREGWSMLETVFIILIGGNSYIKIRKDDD